MAGALSVIPLESALRGVLPDLALGLGASILGGLLLLRFAYVAGEERGAYRRVFRDLKDRPTA